MDTQDLRLPQIPRYQVQSIIGSGGMATVYLAVQESLSRQVALKVMKDGLGLGLEPEFRRRFLKEGRLIAQLAHPNIVTVYDIDVGEDMHYLSMTYLPGGTLKEKIREGAPLANALFILKSLAEALGYAHGQGIVHRDIKPSNVLFNEAGAAVLTDFGIAKNIGEETQLTSAGLTIGSVHYMSPEQVLGDPVDNRSDLYSLGVLFWQTLTGALPYQGSDPFSVALMHTNAPIPKLPKQLRQFQPIVYRLLAKQPSERFNTAEELIQAIAAIPERLRPITAAPRDTTETLPRLRQSQRTAAGLIAAASAPPRIAWMRERRGVLLASAAIGLLVVLGYVGATRLLSSGTPSVAEPQVRVSAASPTPSVVATAAQEDATSALLDLAEAHWRAGKITDPAGDNAFELYSKLLTLDPENPTARQRLVEIGRINAADKLFHAAEQLLRQGAIDDARHMIQTGLKIKPGDERLLGLARALE